MNSRTKIRKSLPHIWLAMHLIFFWVRILFLFFAILKSHDVRDGGCNCRSHRLTSELLGCVVFLSNFNLFQLYQEASSFVSENIFGYYLSIATMVHNALLSMFIPVTAGVKLPHTYWMVFGMFSMTFLGEAVLSLYIVYARRFEYSLEILKKIGASPSVNSAFATRKLLQTFGGARCFSRS